MKVTIQVACKNREAVIPAQAGIQTHPIGDSEFIRCLDSRLRGNDGRPSET